MAKTQEELEQFVSELNEQEEQQYQPFVVTDLESATEASRRISYFNDQMSEIDSIIQKQIQPFMDKIEKIKEWGEQAKQEHQDKKQHYELMLESFMREEVAKQLEAGKKPKKTIKLPYGQIKLQKQQPEYKRNEDELLEYAKEHGFIKVKESADWTSIKKQCQVHDGKLVDENGEIVKGVEVVERDEKFIIKMD